MISSILVGLTILFLIANLYYFFTNKTFKKSSFSPALLYKLFFVLTGLTFGFALLYFLLAQEDTIIRINDPTSARPEESFLNMLYFSGVTILSVGYGDFVPVGSARLFALIEASLGLLLPSVYFMKALNNSDGDEE